VGNKITLVFSFAEEASGNAKKFTFTDFKYEESGGGEQVPDVVAQYIQDQILAQQNNDVEKIIKKGLNAVKNACDRRFQNAMIGNIENLLSQKKYYKGYAYLGRSWFNLERTDNGNKLPYNLEKLYELKKTDDAVSAEYVEVPVMSVKNMLANMKTLFVNQYGLGVEQTEIKDLKETIYFESANNLTSNKLYTAAKDTILSDINVFEKWEYIGQGSSRRLVYTFDPLENALSQKHKIKVIQGQIATGGEVDEINGLSNWGWRFRLNQPTWCNQFVRDLTYNIYKKNDYVVMSKSAAGLNADFKADTTKYMKLSQDVDGNMWKMYINKGYLVFFSDIGHIEVGFPDNKHYEDMCERHPDDERYPKKSSRSQTTTQLTIGAGATVGYKLSAAWATNPKYKVLPFIYLEYLKFEN
jgi:hypothetical protein